MGEIPKHTIAITFAVTNFNGFQIRTTCLSQDPKNSETSNERTRATSEK